jgi:hypothetical protein|nr:MAG TPA: hypothetical protein [Caudoviricetes sp.]
MYKITKDGKEYYSDTIQFSKKAANGCLVPCLAEEAEFVVGKVPEDTVFEGASVEPMNGGSELSNSKSEVNELLQLIADAVEEKYQEDMEVINNV